MITQELVDKLIEAFDNYKSTEGCGCCSDYTKHQKARDKMGDLLEELQRETKNQLP